LPDPWNWVVKIPAQEAQPNIHRLKINSRLLLEMVTALIWAVLSWPTMMLSSSATKLVMRFCRMMGRAVIIALR